MQTSNILDWLKFQELMERKLDKEFRNVSIGVPMGLGPSLFLFLHLHASIQTGPRQDPKHCPPPPQHKAWRIPLLTFLVKLGRLGSILETTLVLQVVEEVGTSYSISVNDPLNYTAQHVPLIYSMQANFVMFLFKKANWKNLKWPKCVKITPDKLCNEPFSHKKSKTCFII